MMMHFGFLFMFLDAQRIIDVLIAAGKDAHSAVFVFIPD
jgi:hypothetical protein